MLRVLDGVSGVLLVALHAQTTSPSPPQERGKNSVANHDRACTRRECPATVGIVGVTGK